MLIAAGLALLTAPALADGGRALFNDNCSGCHQIGGIGSPGLAPPLVDPALFSAFGANAPAYVAGVLLGGLSGQIVANGETYTGLAMPSQSWLTDEELAELTNYVLGELNGMDVRMTASALAKMRAKAPSHVDLLTRRHEAAQ
ncbi:cytochrome c [Kaistia dalseonensis]|nr:cytochrome c [Kaistia dalseonensis]